MGGFDSSGDRRFEPNFIANGRLVTTEMILSATGIAAVFALYEFCRKQDLRTHSTTSINAKSPLVFATGSSVLCVVGQSQLSQPRGSPQFRAANLWTEFSAHNR